MYVLLDEQEFEDEFVCKLQERMQIAERMLKNDMSIEDIMRCTQLTEEQIRDLTENLEE